MWNSDLLHSWARIIGGAVVLAGVISLVLAPLIGGSVFSSLWEIEPLSYIGAVLVIVGLAAIVLSYVGPRLLGLKAPETEEKSGGMEQWSQVTQQYFDLFHHDLGRPLRRILGRERESRAILQSSGVAIETPIKELLDEIEKQTPNFRLMMSNIQVLVQLEAPNTSVKLQALEPSEMVRRIVDRYFPIAAESQKEITWWSEPSEFGIVYSDGSAIEHIVANLVDNATRFTNTHIEIKLTKNPTHFFIRVWDDGPGIAPHYIQHIFDRGWTPEFTRGDEKSSSGLGLFIARSLARRYGGELTVESVTEPDPNHHTAFLLSLPSGEPE